MIGHWTENLNELLDRLEEDVEAILSGQTRPLRVLIVDDEVHSVLPVLELLRAHDFFVQFAFDGPTAIYEFSRFRYDLVIVDWIMPKMDGGQALLSMDQQISEFTKALRGSVPYVVHSGLDEREIAIPETHSMSCRGFVKKGTVGPELIKTINKIINTIEEKKR